MVATDKNMKNLRCNQHYSIYRVEKPTHLTYSVKARLQTVSHKKRRGMSFPVKFVTDVSLVLRLKLITEYDHWD